MSSLGRGLDLLEVLGSRGELSLADVASDLGVSRATAFRCLTELRERGYVEHLRERRTYRLGSGIKTLASRSDSVSLEQLAAPAMASLQASLGETANLALVRGQGIVYAAILEGSYALRMSGTVGEGISPHATALGKAILCALPESEALAFLGREPFSPYTDRTRTSLLELQRDLRKARRTGFAVEEGEMEPHVTCIAAAIRGHDDRPIAAMSMSGLSARLPRRLWPQVGRSIRDSCAQLSEQLK